MRIRSGWFMLLAPLTMAATLLPFATGGCQSGSSGGSGGSGNTGNSTGNTGNVGGGDGGTGNTGGGTGGTTCAPEGIVDGTIQDVTSGTIGEDIWVRITGAVAMSQKFLVSKSSTSGSCLWGFYASAPNLSETAAGTGILVMSRGTDATTDENGNTYCPMIDEGVEQGDAIPQDIQPGDVFNVIGLTQKFLLSQCATEDNGAEVGQFQLSYSCEVTITSTGGPVPTAHVISGADVANLASPTNEAFHDQWGGVKVRVESVGVAEGAGGGGTVVGDYGIITLDDNGIQVDDKIYYRGYQKEEPCHAGPVFAPPVTWTHIDGFHYLNYCTWGLSVNDKCADFEPASTDCGSLTTCAPY